MLNITQKNRVLLVMKACLDTISEGSPMIACLRSRKDHSRTIDKADVLFQVHLLN